jgi:pyruvate/2-oxoglutarate dehydrogenase complex dihydrolipoamide acyltransferase (E2) component
MRTGNGIVMIGMLLLLSACGGTASTVPTADAQDAAAAPAQTTPNPPAAAAPPEATPNPPAAAAPSEATPNPSVPATTGAAQPCAGADVDLTDARRKQYPGLIAQAMDNQVKPKAVEVSRFIGIGTWSAVFATTPVADPGWFVFELSDGRQQFKDVWGGVADEDDRPGLVEWATGLGAPADFATCFAETLVD